MKRKKYETPRFDIRPYTLKDYKAWFTTFTNLSPSTSKYAVTKKTQAQCSLTYFKNRLIKHETKAKLGETFIWAIFNRETGEVVGSIDIHILYRGKLQKANLGYQVYNNFWRQGVAKEALSVVIPKALIDLKLNRLEAVIDLENKPSIALVKSLKLRSEGVRENYYFQDGKWCHQEVFVADRKLYKLPPLTKFKSLK